MGRPKSLRCSVPFLSLLALTAHEPENCEKREQRECKKQEWCDGVSHSRRHNGSALTRAGSHGEIVALATRARVGCSAKLDGRSSAYGCVVAVLSSASTSGQARLSSSSRSR